MKDKYAVYTLNGISKRTVKKDLSKYAASQLVKQLNRWGAVAVKKKIA